MKRSEVLVWVGASVLIACGRADRSFGEAPSDGSAGSTAAQAGTGPASSTPTAGEGGAPPSGQGGEGGSVMATGKGGTVTTGEGGSAEAVCDASETRCTDAELQTCTAAGTWGPTESCGAHQECTGAAGTAACSCRKDSLCTSIASVCSSPAELIGCAEDADGCLYQSQSMRCQSGCCFGDECVQPLVCLVDADGDGYGDEGKATTTRCGKCADGEAPDRGLGKNDCYDDPNYGGANVHPNAPARADREPSGYGYDWNCDGLVELEPPFVVGCSEGPCEADTVYQCGGTMYCHDIYCGKSLQQTACSKGVGTCSSLPGATVVVKCK